MGKSICKRITTTDFCLHHEQTVNGLRKIARASVFRLMSPRLHASISLCFHVYMSPFLHFSKVSMSPCLCLHASMSSCLNVSMSPSLHVYTEFGKRIIELTKNGNFRFYCKQKTKTENFRLFAAN
jgi:hypothetical protein